MFRLSISWKNLCCSLIYLHSFLSNIAVPPFWLLYLQMTDVTSCLTVKHSVNQTASLTMLMWIVTAIPVVGTVVKEWVLSHTHPEGSTSLGGSMSFEWQLFLLWYYYCYNALAPFYIVTLVSHQIIINDKKQQELFTCMHMCRIGRWILLLSSHKAVCHLNSFSISVKAIPDCRYQKDTFVNNFHKCKRVFLQNPVFI